MWSKVGMGGEHHRYYKHNKFRQNPRGDPKFLVDLTRNDPYSIFRVLQTPQLKLMLGTGQLCFVFFTYTVLLAGYISEEKVNTSS